MKLDDSHTAVKFRVLKPRQKQRHDRGRLQDVVDEHLDDEKFDNGIAARMDKLKALKGKLVDLHASFCLRAFDEQTNAMYERVKANDARMGNAKQKKEFYMITSGLT